MFEVSNKFHPFFICCALFLSTPAQSVEIVRAVFNYEGNNHTVDIELFDDIAPLTVTNYLSYVNLIDADGLPSYQDTFIARSETNFVLQTGGATFRPADPNVNALLENGVPTTGLNAVIDQPAVNNEFNLSNLRGTLAMARKGGQENSATKEWFINLSDDNSFLDGVDGGFTVFGRIVDDGMVTIDEINALPIKIKSDELLTAILPGIFYKLPIANSYVDTDPITTALFRKDIVMIDSITQINRPILNLSLSSINFPDDIVNDTVKQSITLTLTNSGNQDLIINPLNALSAPFSIDSDNCSSTTLQPVSSNPTSNCTIIFSLETTTVNTFTEDLVINYDSTPGNIAYLVTLNLQGTGTPSSPELTVSDNALNFGDVILNSSGNTQVLSIQNTGATPLSFNAFTITGIDNDHFSISANSCDLNVVLFANETCTTTIQLDPLTPGSKNAEFNISSDGGNISTALTGNVVTPVLSVETNFSITAQIGSPNAKSLIVTNTGDAGLIINSLSFDGADSTLFTQENNCPGVDTTGFASASLSSDETCIIRIRFSQTSDSEKTAILTLTSNAPDQANIEINISGTGGTDNDGVSDSIEANAPNNGDNNHDGIADNQQNNVASLLSADNGYISFLSDDSLPPFNFPTSLENVALIDQIAAGAPQSANFNVGVYRYSVLLTGGQSVTVGIFLPAGKTPNAYFKFGPTPDNTVPHWYDFTFDVATQTGATFLGEADVLSSTGAKVRINLVLISYIDGQRGDDDLLVNGIILNNQSGPSFPAASSSSGSIYLFPLISFFIIRLLRQRKLCWSIHFNRVSQRFY